MKWEYKIINIIVDEKFRNPFFKENKSNPIDNSSITIINDLGNEGWELVSVIPYTILHGHTIQYVFTFKRPME